MRTIFLLWCLCFAQLALAQQDYFIKFPDDVRWINCPAPPYDFGAPVLYNPNGDSLSVAFEDEMITVVPDACFIIERNWTVKSAAYDPGLPCIYVPNPTPNAVVANPANLPGPIVSPAGTAAPWAPTVVKVAPGDPLPTDYSTFWSAAANCYQYKQHIRIIDTEAPQVANCPATPLLFPDNTPNDAELWNENYWINPVTGGNDLSEAPAELTFEATDNCTGANVAIRCLLFLDLDNDGVFETVVDGNQPPAAGQVNYNNAGNPNFSGGEPRDFDGRAVPAAQKYQFGMLQQSSGFNKSASMRWHADESPGTWITPQLPAGTHKIKWIVEDGCGNTTVCEHTFIVLSNNHQLRTLLGKAVRDENTNCLADSPETALPGWRAMLEPLNGGNNAYAQFSSPYVNGHYRFYVDSGAYRLTLLPANDYWGDCPLEELVDVHSVGDTSVFDFAVQPLVSCPFLETDIGIWGLRRCFNNTYTVRYCNTGTVAAQDASVRVDLDPFMTFVSAGIPAIQEGGHRWRFALGDVPAGECGSFPLTVYLDCDSTVTGQTHCVEAHIYPDSFCLDAPWLGANVEVDGACHPDSVRFVIRNTGSASTALLDYIVIEDNIINFQGMFQLPAGDSMPLSVPANGSTWRLEAEQQPGNPGNPMPSVTVEACGQNAGGAFSIGFVSQFGEADDDPFVSTDCQQSRGSFDPNDKQGFPLGFGSEHLIEPGQALEYLIRFQNTGTDTAFRVIIVDTLSPGLDPASLVPGAASHTYRYTLSGAGIATFTFEPILLPDSFANEAASHGFIKFNIRQQPDLPLGTVITNRAALYFDFNAPVLTNETQHTLGEHFVPVSLPDRPSASAGPVSVSPNPAPAGGQLQLQGMPLTGGRFDLYDGRGQCVSRYRFTGNQVTLPKASLSPGVYFYKIIGNANQLGAGKIMLY